MYYIGIVDDHELFNLLLGFFGNGRHVDANTQRLSFNQNGSGEYIDVKFDAQSNLVGVDDVHLDPEKYTVLKARIKSELIDNQVEKVGRYICFSREKVQGFFRYKDQFQICPPPVDAPTPTYGIGDHPFILEFKYKSSPNSHTNIWRRQEKAVTLIRYLNVICKQTFSYGHRYTPFFWGFVGVGDQMQSKHIQGGYSMPNIIGEVDDFTHSGNEPLIQLVSFKEYYGRFGHSASGLSLPDNLSESIDAIFNLTEDLKKKFVNASGWIDQARQVWSYSHSAAFICIVTAIESLMDKSSKICSSCHQPVYSVTKKFKEFLRAHVSNIDELSEIRDVIYATRSDLAHGNLMFERDLKYWKFLSHKQAEEDLLQRNSSEVVSIALYSWLRNPRKI
jgi:hypothetical protein